MLFDNVSMRIFSTEQLYEADAKTVKNQNITSTDLMERAGIQVFDWLHNKLNGEQVPIHIFCGIGNNGGDGLVIGRHLIYAGYDVKTYILNYSDKRSKDFLINYDRIKNTNKSWPLLITSEDDFPEIQQEDIIVDAIFGIGLSRPPSGWLKELIQRINENGAFTLSIDIPSGLYSDKPAEDHDAIVKSDTTLTFQSAKLSFFLPETAQYAPYFEVLDIGLDTSFLMSVPPIAETFHVNDALDRYKMREKFAHKGTYGHSLIIGGSHGKIGAVVLSGRAALRVGSGLVTCYVPKCGYEILQTALPEAMVITDESEDCISSEPKELKGFTIGLGIGMGTKKESINALKALLKKTKTPVVIDADAINSISLEKDILKYLPKGSILTPHPGELRRLIGNWKNDFDKIEKVKSFSKKHQVVVVIKGANSLVIEGDNLLINTTGNPGMATAGSGDVLTGMITGLLSQGYLPLDAALFGVFIHGLAGDVASGKMGFEAIIASDILENIGNAFMELFRPPEQKENDQQKESSE
jgi:hydroxyethylthiazole kinase-like uncharacterized protein yjeF